MFVPMVGPMHIGDVTTPLFWDCECPDDQPYIHPCTEFKCPRCGALQESADSPDARIAEVVAKGLAVLDPRVRIGPEGRTELV